MLFIKTNFYNIIIIKRGTGLTVNLFKIRKEYEKILS